MKKLFLISLALLTVMTTLNATDKTISLRLSHTTDVHGNSFPYDFIAQKSGSGSYARVASFVKEQRKKFGKNFILLDNGDVLQGQPSSYYYNFIDTVSPHLFSDILNYLHYDAGNMGNHDVETGHAVYDRYIAQTKCPILGANIIETATGKPYLTPYVVIERSGIKIAVLGMITPAIPAWLAENLWSGLHFDDIEKTAKKWIPIIQENEKPDVIIGLFHSGADYEHGITELNENASIKVALDVPGFDIVLSGHDHIRDFRYVLNSNGDSVMVANSANNANLISCIDMTFTLKNGKVASKHITGNIVDLNKYEPDADFMKLFAKQFDAVQKYVSAHVCTFKSGITTRDAYFGPSEFIDLLHELQLRLTNADISFCAPLSFDAEIKAGDVKVGDMFSLMKYENMLYVMDLTGKEIKDYLEFSYDLWINQMHSPNDPFLKLKNSEGSTDLARAAFQNPSYNFDSAAGIIYTVDVTKPMGKRITIISMADGSAFKADHHYRCAVNSYRGNGGGEILTKGAGIPQNELSSRIISSTDKDLRYYLTEYLKKQGTIAPKKLNQWKFIPEDIVGPAAKRDYQTLFHTK